MTTTPSGSPLGDPRGATFGFVVSAIDIEPDRWTHLDTYFADIEAAGCDAIWMTDHLFSGHPSGEALVLATVAAGATSRCAIGTGVLQLALRRSAAVAKAAATLQLISGGRFRLGVGVGQHATEFERAGVDHLRRGVAVDRRLEELSDHWLPSEDWFSMRPNPTVPIWIGGTSQAAVRRTARFGSGWLALFQSPDRFAATNQRIDEALDAMGRDPGSVERHIALLVCPTEQGWSRTDALQWVGRLFPTGSAGVDRYVITGSVSSCIDQIRAFHTAGADGIALQLTHPDPVPRFAALCGALRR